MASGLLFVIVCVVVGIAVLPWSAAEQQRTVVAFFLLFYLLRRLCSSRRSAVPTPDSRGRYRS